MDCFKTPGCVSRCTEEIKFTFDTKVLSEKFKDPLLSRFDLDEKTGDKVHFFVFRRHVDGMRKAHIQFKLKCYSNAI